MKKFILLLLLVLVSVTASARKSYITVYAPSNSNNTVCLTGDVPDDISGFTYDYGSWQSQKYYLGKVLNILSAYGYEVEFLTDNSTSSTPHIMCLLSKEISSGQTISKGDVNTDGEVTIADVNEVIYLILGIVREHPEILEQYGVVLPK